MKFISALRVIVLLLSCVPLLSPVTYCSVQPYSPTTHSDPEGDWSYEENIYDADLSTFGSGVVPAPDPFEQYTGWLYLNFSDLVYVNELCFYFDFSVSASHSGWYYDGGSWHEFLWGSHEGLGWKNTTINDYVSSVKLKLRYSEKVYLYVRELYGVGAGSKKGSGYFVLSVFAKQGSMMLSDVIVRVKPLDAHKGDNHNQTTDERGLAIFELPYGSYLVQAYYDKKVKTMRVLLGNNQNVGFEFKASKAEPDFVEPFIIGCVAGLLGVLFFLRVRR